MQSKLRKHDQRPTRNIPPKEGRCTRTKELEVEQPVEGICLMKARMRMLSSSLVFVVSPSPFQNRPCNDITHLGYRLSVLAVT